MKPRIEFLYIVLNQRRGDKDLEVRYSAYIPPSRIDIPTQRTGPSRRTPDLRSRDVSVLFQMYSTHPPTSISIVKAYPHVRDQITQGSPLQTEPVELSRSLGSQTDYSFPQSKGIPLAGRTHVRIPPLHTVDAYSPCIAPISQKTWLLKKYSRFLNSMRVSMRYVAHE